MPKPTTPPRQMAKPFLKRNAVSDAYSMKSTSTSASLIGESSNPPGSTNAMMGFNRRALDPPNNNNNNNSKIPTSTVRNTSTGIPPLGKGRTHQRVVSGGEICQIKSSLAKKKLYSYAPYIHTLH